MKRLTTLLTGLLASALILQAQQYDVLDQVRADIRKAYGMEGPHRLDEFGTLTKAPKGYKPFYISHYGRHGSRYAWNSETYTLLHNVFEKAAEKDVLTPYGKEFAAKYEDFYMEPWINSGDLVPLGYDQHRAIGEFVYQSFPEVFKGRKKVEALSSTGQRCIVSMGAFNLSLKSGNPELQIRLSSTHDGMTVIAPPSAPKALRRSFKGQKNAVSLESSTDFFLRITPWQEVLDKLFTDSAFIEEFRGGAVGFLRELWQIYCGYHNYESAPLFDDLLTPEQRLRFWEADNYFSFRGDITARYSVIPLLEDMLSKADEALSDPQMAAHLRFGHDYILEALVTLLDVNRCGTVPATPEEAKYWFRNYDIPMAATLLMVFYRNRGGDILFKVVLNEKEALLPQLESVQGPYYRWSDFKAWAAGLLTEHPCEN